MTTLPELARRLVEESPPMSPPELADLRRRNSRRSRRRLALLGTATVAVAALATVTVTASLEGSDDGRRRVNTGPASSTAGTPPPPEPQPVGLVVTPSVLDPDGGTFMSLAVRNDRNGETAWLCGDTRVRLDRWDGQAWRPLGYGFDGGPLELSPSAPSDCLQQGIVAPRSTERVAGPVPSPELEPGWYRWVAPHMISPRDPRRSVPEIEGRFRVEEAVPPSRAQRNSHTVRLAGAERLSGVEPTDVSEALVIDGYRLALTWDTECNEPGASVTFALGPDRVEVQVLTGSFFVIDCVGDPAGWSTVVELPESLAGRPLVVVGPAGDRVATEVGSQGEVKAQGGAEPDNAGGTPVSLGSWLQRAGSSDLVLRWHGSTCDRALNLELINLGDRLFPRASVTDEECPLDDRGRSGAAAMTVPGDLRHLPIVGVP